MKPFTLPNGQPELPDGWRWVRTRFLCDVETGTSDTVGAVDEGDYPFFVRSDEIEHSNEFTYDTEAVMTSGDGAGVGKIFHHYSGRFLAHQRVYVMSQFRGCVPRFFYYYLSSEFGPQVLAGTAKSTVESLRRHMLTDFVVAVPRSREEQENIVAFLDRETAQIDAMIGAQRDLVAALEDRRGAVLEGALNDVWAYPHRRLQWVYRVSSDCNQSDLEVLSVYRDFGVIPKSSRTDNFNKTPENVERYLVVRPNDLVINRMKAWQGSLGVSSHLGIVSGDYEVVRPVTPELLPEFAHFMLRSPRLIGEYRARSTGIRPAQWRLYWDQMGRVDVPIPPLDVQEAQLPRVKASLSRIDATINAANDSIALMQERRAALISAAVTGRIDPRTGKETTPGKVLESV